MLGLLSVLLMLALISRFVVTVIAVIAVITLCVLLDLNCKEKSLKKQKVDCTTGATSFSTILSISFKIKEYIITFY